MAEKRKTKRKSKTKRRKNPKRVKAGKKAARKRKRSSKPKKKNKSKKTRKKPMAGKGGIKSKLQSPLIKKVLMAAGLVSIATAVATIVLPSQAQLINSPVVKTGLGFLVGDIPGAVTNFVLATGVGGLGGNGNAASVSQQGNSGFA